jgi:hypothetical protein
MRHRVRGVLIIVAVLTCFVNGVAIAQDKPADDMETLRERARADKKAVVASALALTESEAKAFWPVYNAYQSDMITHYDKLLSLVDRFDKAYDTMTDQTASQLLNEYLALEASYVALLKAYVPRFQRVLPALKVARLYQIENKMRALINFDLARQIRFVK